MNGPTPTTAAPFTDIDRRALGAVAVQFFVNGAVFASYVPRLPEIRERIGVGLDGLGVLMTLAIAIGLAGSLRAPAFIDRLGTRRTLIIGGMILVGGLTVIGVADSPLVFVVGVGSLAFADGLVDVSMNLQGSWLSARRHTPVMNRLHGLWSLGTVVGSLVAARVAAVGVSLEWHLTVAAVALAAALVFVGRGLLTADEDHAEVGADDGPDTGTQADPDADPDAPVIRPGAGAMPSIDRYRRIRRGLWLLAIAGGFAITTELVASDWAAFRLAEDFGASAGFAGLGFVAFTIGMTSGRLAGDAVVGRFGGDAVLRGAVVVAALGLSTAAFVPNRWLVLVAYGVAGVGVATFFPKLYDDAARASGRRGQGLAWLRSGSAVTQLVVPTIVGVLASTALSVGAAVAIVTLPCVVGLLVLSLRR